MIPDEGGSLRVMVDKDFEDLPDEFKDKLSLERSFNEAVPTLECSTGMRGRTAVFEVFSVDKEVQKIILSEPNESNLWDVARKKGMLTMKEDAMLKCMEGKVPFSEIGWL